MVLRQFVHLVAGHTLHIDCSIYMHMGFYSLGTLLFIFRLSDYKRRSIFVKPPKNETRQLENWINYKMTVNIKMDSVFMTVSPYAQAAKWVKESRIVAHLSLNSSWNLWNFEIPLTCSQQSSLCPILSQMNPLQKPQLTNTTEIWKRIVHYIAHN